MHFLFVCSIFMFCLDFLILGFFFVFFCCICVLSYLLSANECVWLSAFFFSVLLFFIPFCSPGFWIVSESDDNVSDLRSYESNEYESDEVGSCDEEEVQYAEEEAHEIDESDNDIEVMEILAVAQKQSQIEKRSEPADINRNEEISDSNSNINTVVTSAPKVCMHTIFTQQASRRPKIFFVCLKFEFLNYPG